MTNKQDIFKGFGPNWKWASMSSGGIAKVYVERPYFPGPKIEPRARKGTLNEHWDYAPAFDQKELPPEGLEPCVWERTEFDNGPSYDTDKFGQRLSPPVVCPPPVAPVPVASLTRSHLQAQLDANGWANFAAIDSDGVARLFAEQPHRFADDRWGALGEQMRAGGTFDTSDWETMLYPTTRPVPQPVSAHVAPARPIPEGFTELTSAGFDYGDVARVDVINLDGARFTDCVPHTVNWEIVRAYRVTAEKALSAADLAPGFPEGEDEEDSQHGWAEELEEAKERAAHLLQHDALTLVQYMAIFGERP